MPGVYGISNAREWIHIGETENIQAALLEQVETLKSLQLDRQPTGFVFELCDRARRPARVQTLTREFGTGLNQARARTL